MAHSDIKIITLTITEGGYNFDAATAAEPDLLPWVESNVSFPNAMVDRITPVT
eukprot:gene34971-43123_t